MLHWAASHLTPSETHEIDLTEVAVRVGLQRNLTRHAPLMRTLSRLCFYQAAAWNPEPNAHTDGRLLIVDHLPPVSTRQVARWPAALAVEHQQALARHRHLGHSA